jgi:hypothetical protein
MVHSWNVPVEGSKCATLFPKNSRNQQQFPLGSKAKPQGPLFGVGTVHSVNVAGPGGAYTGRMDVVHIPTVAVDMRKSERMSNACPKVFGFFAA